VTERSVVCHYLVKSQDSGSTVENRSKVDFPFTKEIGALPMRGSQMFIDQDGLWFQGNDGTREYVSVKVDRQGLEKLLTWMATLEATRLEGPATLTKGWLGC
jgi:hypothetical protein